MVVSSAAAQTDQAASKLAAANLAVGQAFNGVLGAEKAGANVTGLLVQLNVAEGFLAQAENSYRTGDSSAAAAQADSVLPVAQQITAAAQNAKQAAVASARNGFWETIAFTAVGLAAFVIALLFAWSRVRRNYIKNLLKAKPEVVNR